jgi:hypothetical protein
MARRETGFVQHFLSRHVGSHGVRARHAHGARLGLTLQVGWRACLRGDSCNFPSGGRSERLAFASDVAQSVTGISGVG